MFRQAQQWHRHHQWGDVAQRIVDDEGYTFHRQFVQNVEPIIDANTRIRNEANGRVAASETGARKVGSIPVTIVYDKIRKWHAEGRLDRADPGYSMRLNELLKNMLRDRDYAKFRTTEHV